MVPGSLLEILKTYFVSSTILKLASSSIHPYIESVVEIQNDLSRTYAHITGTPVMNNVWRNLVYDLMLITLGLNMIFLKSVILALYLYISIHQLYWSIREVCAGLLAVFRCLRSFWSNLGLFCSFAYWYSLCQIWIQV